MEKLELTGKCKESFEKWYTKDISDDFIVQVSRGELSKENTLTPFYSLTGSMKYGVCVDYFDSVGLELVVHKFKNKYVASVFVEQEPLRSQLDDEEIKCNKKGYNSRPEARTKAIEKANEIFNEL